MKLKTKVLLLLVVLIQVIAVVQWVQCSGFLTIFRFSAFDLNLRLLDLIHSDQGVTLWQVRLFHNKVMGTLFDTIAHYLRFWDVLFLTSFVSLAGVFGIFIQAYYFLFKKKKSRLANLLLITLLVSPFLVIFYAYAVPFVVQLIVLAAPLIGWAVLGYKNLFSEKKINIKIIYLLLLVSLWYQFAPPVLGTMCRMF